MKTAILKKVKQEEWQDLYESIEQGKCVICVGSGMFAGEDRQESSFASFLRNREEDLGIRVYENGWFHYRDGARRVKVYKRIKEFYNRPINHDTRVILDKLALIPGHLYLSLTPCSKLTEAFHEQHLPVQNAYYDKEKTHALNPFGQLPTKGLPLVYNLLGSVQEQNSLVLTYDDFFQFLQSINRGKGMDEELKEGYLLGAHYYLFLGVPFDMWYAHIFMRILQQHILKDRVEKFAANIFIKDDDTAITHCYEQYKLTFISQQIGIESFINGLFDYCRERKKLRSIDFALIKRYVSEEAWTPLFEHLWVKLSELGEPAENELNRSKFLEKTLRTVENKLQEGLLTEQEFQTEMENLKNEMQEFVEELVQNFPNVTHE